MRRDASPRRCSTSVGRRYDGSTSTSTRPLAASTPFSAEPLPFQVSVQPARPKARSQNSRTEWLFPVAMT